MKIYNLYVSNPKFWGLPEPDIIGTYWGEYFGTLEEYDPFKLLQKHRTQINSGKLTKPTFQLEQHKYINLKWYVYTFVMGINGKPSGNFQTVDFIRVREFKRTTFYIRLDEYEDGKKMQSYLFILDPVDRARFYTALHRWRKAYNNEN